MHRSLAIALAFSASSAFAATHTIPQKTSSMTGSAFIKSLGGKTGPAREAAALAQLLAGNIPSFLRKFVPISVTAGTSTVRFWVSPDVLAIGDDNNFVRIPLTPQTAQAVHDCYGTSFVTAAVTDWIHTAARARIDPLTNLSCGDTDDCYLQHNKMNFPARYPFPKGKCTVAAAAAKSAKRRR